MKIRMRYKALVAAAAFAVLVPTAAGELKPVDLSAGGTSASSPRIASDGAGNVIAVWREVDGDAASIRAAYQPKGAAFGSSRAISVPAAATEAPELAMDRRGNAVAVWQRSNGRDSVVQAAVRPAGSNWSEPTDLSAPGDSAFSADVAVEAGQATAVWLVLRDRRTLVQSSSRTIDGTWSTPETVSGPVGNTYGPAVAMDDHGGAVAAWQWSNGAYLVVQAALRGASGAWSGPEVLSGAGRSASRPQVAMDGEGDAFVAWARYNGSWTAAQVAQRLAGGTWEPARNLSERGGNASALDIAVNRRGDGVITWIQTHLASNGDLYSAFRAAGNRRWSARVPIAQAWYNLQTRVAIDEVGNSTAVWSGALTVSASFRPVGEAWQEDYLLSNYDDAAAQPVVTTQAPREATAAWIRSANDGDRVQSVFYDVNTSKEEHQDDEEEEEDEDEGDDEELEGETFRGTPEVDRLVGTPGNDVFYGLGGNDRIDGRGGRDVVYGGRGNDRIVGGAGGDRLIGGPGADRILGGRGRDVLRGDAGPDVLRGGSGGDFLYGMAGDDTLDAGRGRDLAYGGVADDLIVGGTGADRLVGGAGADRLFGAPGRDDLIGGYGRDLLSGNGGDDTLRGLDRSADIVIGGRGLDVYSLDRWLDRARSIESRL